MTALSSIPALRSLAPDVLSAIARESRPARFGPGAVLRHRDEPATVVPLLLSGTVVAEHVAPSGVAVWVARWAGPAIADKAAVLDGGPPPTRLLAVTAVTALLLPGTRFRRLLDDEPSVRDRVLARLAGDVMAGGRRLAQAATLPGVARLAAWLAEQDPAQPVAWRGSQDDLARLLGMSRVTVNRALARLAEAGAVRVEHREIVVADRARLADM